ncbi:hypothetical protein DM01DRAFT_1087208 [Hesseltinella vesiculosa]|uniref:Uncharacterized protein n=1 Tax=Hesseltinella vesiculosa TaxID=101127 RepID=A0A1X2GDE2_9FUNG|nr:hypothetical protein DM01DRAFT_1087208 [Hesseltinella vesiculosa]
MKADLASAELIDSAVDLRMASSSCSINDNIHATMMEANDSVHQATAIGLADPSETIVSTRDSQDNNSSNETKLTINDDVIVLHEDTSSGNWAEDPWIFKNTNVTQLFRSYQATIRGMIDKHQTLPIESYIHELAAHTHTLVLCKNQQSSIAERVFSKSLLTDLTTNLVSDVVDLDLPFPQDDLFALTTTISNLVLGTITREQTMLDLFIRVYIEDVSLSHQELVKCDIVKS